MDRTVAGRPGGIDVVPVVHADVPPLRMKRRCFFNVMCYTTSKSFSRSFIICRIIDADR